MTDKETRLARWSRLKARSRKHKTDPGESTDFQQQTSALSYAVPAVEEGAAESNESAETGDDLISPEPADLESLARDHGLPSPESLNAGSDFSQFMRDDVPEMLKRAALRKLWACDPVLANLDGLNDYDEDFTVISAAAGAIGEGARKLADTMKTTDEDNSSGPVIATVADKDNDLAERSAGVEEENAITHADADDSSDNRHYQGLSSDDEKR